MKEVGERNMENQNIEIEIFESELNEVSSIFHIFDFVTIPSCMAVISPNSSEPIYLIKVNDNRRSNQKLKERHNHVVFSGENYFRGFICNHLDKNLLIKTLITRSLRYEAIRFS